jgi:hypothetical protein
MKDIRELRVENARLREAERVARWAELLLREIAPDVAKAMRDVLEGGGT